MPHRERYLFVCTNRRDADNPKGLAGRLRACTSSCLDLCEIGASIVQEPEHVAYGRVKLEDVDAIVDAAGRGEVLERLVVHRGGAKEKSQ